MNNLSPEADDSFECCSDKPRFCFICAAGIPSYSKLDDNDDDEEASCSSSLVSLEVFLKGVDIFCEALQIDRKPFARRDNEWMRFAELDQFVRYICCPECSKLLFNLVDLHELILKTKKRLESQVHLIEKHIVDSNEESSADEIEYFDRSCIQFRKDVLTKFEERTKEAVHTKLLDISTSPRVVINAQKKNIPKAKRSKPFNHPPTEKLIEDQETNIKRTCFIKREVDESRNSEDFLPSNSFSCDDNDPLIRSDENDEDVLQSSSNSSESDKDSDFEYISEDASKSSSSSSSEPEDELFIPDVKRRKISEKDPLELRNDNEPEPCSPIIQAPVKRKRGRPRKYPVKSVTAKIAIKPKKESQSLKRNGKTKASKRYQKMWREKDDLLQHGPCARPIVVLNPQTGEMLYLHVKIQLQMPVLSCKHPECDFSLNNVVSFGEQEAFLEIKRHIRNSHRKCFMSKVSGSEGGYCCCFCEKLFPTRTSLYAHKRSHHHDNQLLPNSICEICGRILQQKNMFQHSLSHKNSQEKLEMLQIRKKRKKKHQTSTKKPQLSTNVNDLENVNSEHCSSFENTEDFVNNDHGTTTKRDSKQAIDHESMSSSDQVRKIKVRKYQYSSKRYQKMWKTKDELLQHGPAARTILVLDSSRGEMSYLHVKFQLQKPDLHCKHPECDFSVKNITSFAEQEAFLEMKRHIRDTHRKCNKSKVSGAEGGYCCYYCDSVFVTKAKLLHHFRSQHPHQKRPDSLCEICGTILKSKYMYHHVHSHKNEQEKLEASQIKIRRHKPKIRPPDFPCNQCNKIFSSSATLRAHQMTHINVDLRKQYECDICFAKLTSATGLKYHKQDVHSKIVHFTCDFCGQQFTRTERTSYDIHVRRHTGDRPYQCAQCGKSCISKQALTIHEKSHENQNIQIQCEYCPNSYNNEQSLKRHQKKHHPSKVNGNDNKNMRRARVCEERPDFIGPKLAFPCEPCGKVFRYKSVFVTHMKTKHKLVLENNVDYPNQNIL